MVDATVVADIDGNTSNEVGSGTWSQTGNFTFNLTAEQIIYSPPINVSVFLLPGECLPLSLRVLLLPPIHYKSKDFVTLTKKSVRFYNLRIISVGSRRPNCENMWTK